MVSFDWLQRTVIWETGVEEAHLVKKHKTLLAAAHARKLTQTETCVCMKRNQKSSPHKLL